jgi:hypothetical protein
MTTQFNWIVSQLECAPSENDLSNVIKTIHWRYQAQNGDLFADTYDMKVLKFLQYLTTLIFHDMIRM